MKLNGNSRLGLKGMKVEKEFTPSRIYKHVFLLIIIYLLINSLMLLRHMIRTDYPYDKFGNIVVVLMLLFKHIAFFYTKSGLASKIMKTLAWAWIIIGSIYIGWISFII